MQILFPKKYNMYKYKHLCRERERRPQRKKDRQKERTKEQKKDKKERQNRKGRKEKKRAKKALHQPNPSAGKRNQNSSEFSVRGHRGTLSPTVSCPARIFFLLLNVAKFPREKI